MPQHHPDIVARDAESVEQIDVVTRLRVAEVRISKLERQVIELQAAPADVETDILKQRLKVTETALAVAALKEDSTITSELPSAGGGIKTSAKPKTSSKMERDSPEPPANIKSPAPGSRLRLVDPKTFELQR